MELIELKNKIIAAFAGDVDELNNILTCLEEDKSIFPLNEYEYLICNLLHVGGLTFNKYIEIRNEYISENPHLWIFEISAPRGFGEKFAQTYVRAKCSILKSASKKWDAQFSGEYDLFLDGIKIEVKASRAVDRTSEEPLYMKALSRATQKSFLMNFQQLKPQCCDVFVWLAVFRDEIVLWVMSSDEVATHPFYSKGQHRGNIGNEGQLHITNENINMFEIFQLKHGDLGEFIKNAAKRNKKLIKSTGKITHE